MPEWKLTNHVLDNPLGFNTILVAVLHGDLSWLLEHLTSRNVNSCDLMYRLTALHWAVTLGRVPTTRLLLARGAALTVLDIFGFTPLHRAVWCGSVELIRALLFMSPPGLYEEEPPLQEEINTNKMCLELTPKSNHSNHPPEHRPDGSYMPYEQDPKTEDTEPSTKRNTHNNNISPINNRETPPLHRALDGNNENGIYEKENVQNFKPHTHVKTHIPARTWRPGARRLVELPHAATGRTALLLAALRGDVEVAAVLLHEAGANLRAVDRTGLSALDLAALCGHRALVEMLLREADSDVFVGSFHPGVQSGAMLARRLRERAEEFCETAKNLPQRRELAEINRLVCLPLAGQSFAGSS